MRYRRRIGTLALFVLVAISPGLAVGHAQEGERGRANRDAPPLTNARLAAMLDTYAIVEAQNFLQLSDDQYGQFVARLKRLQDTRRRNMQARNRMLQDLRRMTAPDAATDETTVRDRVQALRAFDEEAFETMRREYEAVDELLNPRQQARFRILEERMEFRKLDILVRARERARSSQQQRDGAK